MSYKNRYYKLFLKDIFDSANKILEYTKDYNQEKFLKDFKTIDAVEYILYLLQKLQNSYLIMLKMI